MKFLLTVAAIIAVAVAGPTERGFITPGAAGPAHAPVMPEFGPAVIDAFEPIAIGPAIIDSFEPAAIGPAFIDFPVPERPVVIEAAPTAVAETDAAPLVQIILNINHATKSSPVAVPEPIDIAEPVQIVDNWPVVGPISPVHVVDNAPVSPVQVVDATPVSPVQVVDVSPVQVVETAPITVEPVIIGTPVLPSPAVVLPEELN